MAQEEDHNIPVEEMMSRPADDEARHEALCNGLADGAGEHVNPELGPPECEKRV